MKGTCECGCGTPTRIAPKTDRSKGWVRGEPLRFAFGHNARVTNGPRRTFSEADYAVEDRGHETPCWIWKGKPVNGQGYCRVGVGGRYLAAHRAYYEEYVGPVPTDDDLHHLCEQHACVRPGHLRPIPKGEHLSLHKRRLTDDQVEAIRHDDRLLREIAADYGISTTHASDIRRGKARVAA